MDTVLGLLELAGWILLVLAIAAAVTFTMIKASGRIRRKPADDDAAASAGGS